MAFRLIQQNMHTLKKYLNKWLKMIHFSFDFVPAIIVPNYCKSGILKSLRESVGLQITINEKDLDDTYLVSKSLIAWKSTKNVNN